MKTDTKTIRRKAGLSILIISTMGLLIVLYVNLIYPIVEDTMAVWEMFLIFYVLITLLWIFVFSSFWGFDRRTIRASVLLLLIVSVFDFYAGSSAVDFNGAMVIGADKWSIDYFFGYYITNTGLSGILVFIIVYLLIPILFLTVALLILKPRKFLNATKQGVV